MSYQVLAPLEDFAWDGRDFEIAPDTWIRRFQTAPDLSKFDDELSSDEWERAYGVSHWLVFEWDGAASPKPRVVTDLALLALWLVKPTKAHISFRFQLDKSSRGNGRNRTRVLDRFASIEGHTFDKFTTDDLKRAATYYSRLLPIYLTGGRLRNAVLVTVTGCWSHFWQSAFVCHAAAVEAILTFETGTGISHRLASSYACMVETETSSRDVAYWDFMDLYSVRSDIMHGRSHNVLAGARLTALARFQNILRKLWQLILMSSELASVLEGTDEERAKYFAAMQHDYKPSLKARPIAASPP